jgi:transposase
LAPVHVAAPEPTATSQQPTPEEPPRSARPVATKKGLIEIDFGSGRRVRVDADVDAAALAVVLDVLERR